MTTNLQISSAYVDAYYDDVLHLLDQFDSRIYGMVDRVETTRAENHFFERIDSDMSLTIKGRAQQTSSKAQNPVWSRRQVMINTFDLSMYYEFNDLYNMLVNPEPQYQRQLVKTVNKRKDDIVYQAAIGDATNIATDGNGVHTTTQVALPSSQIISKDVGGADSGLNINKLKAARGLNLTNENMDRMTLFLSGKDYEDLLNDEQVINGDYIVGSPITTGSIGTLLGFDLVVYNFLDGDGQSATPRKCLLMDSQAVAVATGPEMLKMRVDELPTESYRWQLYVALTMAAVRMEEQRVIVIETVDS